MTDADREKRAAGWLKAAVFTAVVGIHGAVFLLIADRAPKAVVIPDLPIEVSLFRPEPVEPVEPPPPPPEPEPEPAQTEGGGAPAAPSRVRSAQTPPPRPEVVAPPRPAPEPTLVIGASPNPTPAPAPAGGQGGQGTGAGGGSGSGQGAGTGTVRGRPVRQATTQELRALHPPQARGRSGRVSVTCRVELDGRLDGCRVASETPPGLGFGAAGVAAATRHYRFTPWVRDGREVEGEITVIVEFGRPPR